MANGGGAVSSLALKFLDKLTSSRYGCDVCMRVEASALKAQCCGAIYCQPCAELVRSSAAISGEGRSLGSLVSGNPVASTCTKCKSPHIILLPDTSLQESVNRLHVECQKPGCGWVGEFSAADTHLKQPHDADEEIYDNEAPEPDGDYEEEVYDNELLKEPMEEEIYDNNSTQEAGEEEIYDNDEPQNQVDELYDETPLQPTAGSDDEAPAQDNTDEIYEEAPAEVDEGENYESPLVSQSVNLQPASTAQSQPPSDYRALAVENLAQQPEPTPGKNHQDLPMSQNLSAERGSVSSSGSKHRNLLCLGFYSCTHSEDFSDLTSCEKLVYVIGFLLGSLWVLFAVPVVVIAVVNGVQKVQQGDTSIVPDCGNYSIALLLAVVVVNIVMAIFLIFWLLRGSFKCCQGKRANRATVSSLCVLALIYAAIVVGFSASILAFAAESRNVSISSNSTTANMSGSGSGSGSWNGEMGESGVECEIMMDSSGSGESGSSCDNRSATSIPERKEVSCVEFSNQPFVLAIVFLGLLVLFAMAVLFLVWYEWSYNGCCYKREIYDPTVVVIQNQATFGH